VTDRDITYEQRGDRILVRRESTGEAIGILPVTRLRFTVPKTYYEYANYEVTWVDDETTHPST